MTRGVTISLSIGLLSRPESDIAEERQYADSAYVRELCNEALKVTIASGDIERMYRLGRKEDGKTRPLLVQFKDEA